MLDRLNENKYLPHPKLVKALDILFMLHAEHELNCSTSAVRHLCSSGVDVYSCVSGAAAALYGPKHVKQNKIFKTQYLMKKNLLNRVVLMKLF